MCDSLKLFFVLAYHSGCRSGELKNLKWSQVYRRPDSQGYVTNMTQVLSIPEIMNIIGHKTMAMFIRYNIVSRKGITEAGKKMTAWMKQASEQGGVRS
jgi:hypothetical protein